MSSSLLDQSIQHLLTMEQSTNRELNEKINELWRQNVIMKNALEKIINDGSCYCFGIALDALDEVNKK